MAQVLTREEVAAKFATVEGIINATNTRPTIVNESSKFVVCTYWWGRGNLNRNTARPCIDFYEAILEKPIHILTAATATKAKFKYAITNNKSFMNFLKKKAGDYKGTVRAYIAEGKPVSAQYQEMTEEQIVKMFLVQILPIMEQSLPEIQQLQRVIVERADLEETFKRRVESGLTQPAQLETIKRRLEELKNEKTRLVGVVKSRFGPAKDAFDRVLRYQDPIRFEAMIENWENICAAAGCNYMAVEYPEFARPGGYQLAINAKPRFIQKAIELCGNRGVLYIDGDMTVNKYPAIFDTPDVDMMARGWNVDPRSSYKHNEDITVDPYVFETSGGIMFFAQTPEAHLLLRRWIEVSETYSQWGKADDRILSLVFNTYKLLLPMKIIQLPVEYLWLSLDYDDSIEETIMDRDLIFIEHPECLTSEESAEGQGASSVRTPKFYSTIETTYPRSELLMENVLFETQEDTIAFRPYFDYLTDATYFETVEDDSLIDEHPFQVVPFANGFGTKYNQIAGVNAAAVAALPPLAGNVGEVVIRENDASTIPRILQALDGGKNVRYMPESASQVYISSLESALTRFDRIEFAFVNKTTDKRDIFYFQSIFNSSEPAFFRTGSKHLMMLLSMCTSLDDLQTVYKNNYQLLSRIRTHFLKRPLKTAGLVGGGNGEEDQIAQKSENAMNFLYGAGNQAGGRRRRTTYRRRRNVGNKRRQTRQRKYNTRRRR